MKWNNIYRTNILQLDMLEANEFDKHKRHNVNIGIYIKQFDLVSGS
jgi:hypothetical protein